MSMRLYIRDTSAAQRDWERFLGQRLTKVEWLPPLRESGTGTFHSDGSSVTERGLLIVHPDPGERVLAVMGTAGEDARLCIVTVAGADRDITAGVHRLVYRREAALRNKTDLAVFAACVDRFLFEYERAGSPDFRLLEPDQDPENLIAVYAIFEALTRVSHTERDRIVKLWTSRPEEERHALWLAASDEYRVRAGGAAEEWVAAGLSGRLPFGERARTDPDWRVIDYGACADVSRRALLNPPPSASVDSSNGYLATELEGA